MAEIEAGLAACEKYVRRMKRGLPTDRFTEGADGARLVGEGIQAMFLMLETYKQIVADFHEDQMRRADDMEPHKDPMR